MLIFELTNKDDTRKKYDQIGNGGLFGLLFLNIICFSASGYQNWRKCNTLRPKGLGKGSNLHVSSSKPPKSYSIKLTSQIFLYLLSQDPQQHRGAGSPVHQENHKTHEGFKAFHSAKANFPALNSIICFEKDSI